MKGDVITNGELAVYDRAWEEEFIPNTKRIRFIDKKTIIAVCSNGKEKSIFVDEAKEVLLHKLENLLWGNSNVHYDRITQEDRDRAFQKIISEPHRNSQICKRFEIYKSIENMTSIVCYGMYFYLDNKADVIYLIHMLKWVCKDILDKKEDFQLMKYEDFKKTFPNVRIMNL